MTYHCTAISEITKDSFIARDVMMKLAALLLTVSLPLISHAGGDGADGVPWVKDSGKNAYADKFLTGSKNKAFAISESGSYAWTVNRDSAGRAAQIALYNCLKNSNKKCFLYAVDDKTVFENYSSFDDESKAALANLVPPRRAVYANEDKDAGISAFTSLKSGQLHEPTPSNTSVAKTISTATFVEMLSSATKPLVLDVLEPGGDFQKAVIPSAIWIRGAGVFDENWNRTIEDNFSKLMTDLAPRGDTPIVVYCLSWECWLSYNALLRLFNQGYSNLYWYRGGLESWQKAELPTIRTTLHAQLW